jgi:hypothetical protein
MRIKMKSTIIALSLIASFVTTSAYSNEYADQLNVLAAGKIHEIAQSSEVVAAITAQNAMSSGYDQAKIDALDQQWRAEVDASDKPMIDGVLATSVSAYLLAAQDQSEGLFTEIFATDAKGLNVGQSGVTSDYWQGDEDKWQTPFNTGATDVSDIEEDASTQTFQSQVSVPVMDEAGNRIGAITFGVNVELL